MKNQLDPSNRRLRKLLRKIEAHHPSLMPWVVLNVLLVCDNPKAALAPSAFNACLLDDNRPVILLGIQVRTLMRDL